MSAKKVVLRPTKQHSIVAVNRRRRSLLAVDVEISLGAKIIKLARFKNIGRTVAISLVATVTLFASLANLNVDAVTVSTRNELVKRTVSKDPLFKCGKVPVYQKVHKLSIEPGLHQDHLTVTNQTSSNSTSEKKGDFRILHGLDAKTGEWPWIVKIDLCEPNKDCETCTGSLVNERWLVTAGHCALIDKKQITYKATLGQYDLLSKDSTAVEIIIDKVIRHPAYSDLTNDLSLMRLSKPVEFNEFIQPICLLEPTRDILAFTKSMVCMNIGYGLMENMMAAVKLQKMLIQPRPAQDCNSDKLDGVQLRTGTVCIGPPEGTIGGSCHGDSGGPDACYDPANDQWLLVGTVSYGPEECDREQGSHWLTVSVDLSNYRTWIVETVSKDS